MSPLSRHAALPSPGGGGAARVSPIVPRRADDDNDNDDNDDNERAAKRRKTESKRPCHVLDKLHDHICKTSRVARGDSLQETLVNMCDAVDGKDEESILAAMKMLGHALCTIDGTSTFSEYDPVDDAVPVNAEIVRCDYCGVRPPRDPLSQPDEADAAIIACIFGLFETLATQVAPQTGALAVRALYLLCRMAVHSAPEAVLDYETSNLCRWCVSQLRSADRAVRIQAAKTLAVFGRQRDDALSATTKRNRWHFDDLLRGMAENGDCLVQETSAVLWNQLGRVVAEDQLYPVLSGLLKLLDSPYKPVCDAALSEIRYLSSSFGCPPKQLFEPYWSATAHIIVRHIAHHPASAPGLANLVGTTAPKLVLQLEAKALPELLLAHDLTSLANIAELRGDGAELWPTLLEKDNLTAILAFWVQLPPHVSSLNDLMRLLHSLSPRLGPATIREMMGSSATPVLGELLMRMAYDVRRIPGRYESMPDGLGFQPVLTIARLLSDPADTQTDEALARAFLSKHLLGLTTYVSRIHTNEGVGMHLCHWIRGIEALEILIRFLRADIRTARPQVTSFLLDALCTDGSQHAACWQTGMRRAAISCWAALVRNIGDENIAVLLETTFAVIRTNWDQFGDGEKATCRDLLAWLLGPPEEDSDSGGGGGHRASLLEKIDVLPPLRVPELAASVDAVVDGLRRPLGAMQTIDLFAQRIGHESVDVVRVALADAQAFLQGPAAAVALQQQGPTAGAPGETSTSAVAHFVRALFDCSAKYSGTEPELSAACLACIGLVGCVDASRLGAVGKEPPFVVVWNLRSREEGLDFVLYMLQHVLTRAFLAATNTVSQGLVAYAVQTLLSRCGISAAVLAKGAELPDVYAKWTALPELVQVVLSPLLVSKYHITPPGPLQARYPLFCAGRTYGEWVKLMVARLLTQAQNPFGEILYEALFRAARGRDLSVAEFLLPYMVVHVVAGQRSTAEERAQVTGELQRIAQYQPPDEAPAAEREQAKLFYDAVFRVIEYAMVWLRTVIHYEQPQGMEQVEAFLAAFPAEVLAQKALYCKDYARAVFFLEPVAMGGRTATEDEGRRAQAESDMIDLYAQIDDPDCLSGILAKVGSMVETSTYHKALLEQKAGRWESATTWHLSELSAAPDDGEIQARVLTCLLAAGHHEALLARVDGLRLTEGGARLPAATVNRVLPLALEAAWATFQWPRLAALVPVYKGDAADAFPVGLAQALLQLQQRRGRAAFAATLDRVAARVAASMSYSTTSSLEACHDAMLKAHVVTDLRLIGGVVGPDGAPDGTPAVTAAATAAVLATLVQRLDGVEDVRDKRYVLAVQRAAMEALRPVYGDGALSALWLLSARLARKTGANGACLHAIAQARRLGDPAAEVENARRQWAWGGKHQAIADLRTALGRGLPDKGGEAAVNKTTTAPLAARASLLLTRWLDASGETSRTTLRDEYRALASRYNEWEKSHYFLGRHYKKVLEAEEGLGVEEQSDMFVSGELARLEIEAYLRAARLGTKYLHTTLPRVLTLWLGLGMQLDRDRGAAGGRRVSAELRQRREEVLHTLHRRLLRHVQKLPAFTFYTALPQLVARINHPHRETCTVLDKIIAKVVVAYPQQALWGVVGVMTARGPKSNNQSQRAASRLLKALTAEPGAAAGGAGGSGGSAGRLPSVQSMTRRGVQLAEELVKVGRKGNYRAHNSSKTVSLRRDLHFQLASEAFPFVVPIGRCLTAVLPGGGGGGGPSAAGATSAASTTDSNTSSFADVSSTFAAHNAFASDVITIASFADEAVILGSLAQPRRLTMRGSDGRVYDVLLKPKDDMRTDQRIMEVNTLINEALRKDAEAQRRQLAIRTYAVTPLNEDCGLIEWVQGLKTLREIVRPYYDLRRSQVQPRPPDPLEIQKLLAGGDAGGGGGGSGGGAARRARIFASQVLPAFPPVLQEWFMRRFPYPAAWLAARQRFTRSAAVMSMAGAVLGLGDRHCENVLVDAGGSGGVMHVDFNCLFDKGRLFAQPETVPFRLTHNMRAAMGLCDHRGPFQRACELTLQLLREQEETLLAVLEAFVHDPTLDLQADPRRAGGAGGEKKAAAEVAPAAAAAAVVRLDPPSVIRNIKRRINGLLFEETIPLGVEGQATELIKQATDPVNLSAMYIGWAPHW